MTEYELKLYGKAFATYPDYILDLISVATPAELESLELVVRRKYKHDENFQPIPEERVVERRFKLTELGG